MGTVDRRGFMQIIAAAAGAVVCLGPAALAARKSIVEYGQAVEFTHAAQALTPALTKDWKDVLRFSIKLGMGNDGYKPMPETEEWSTLVLLASDRVALIQKGKLMSREERHTFWLNHTPEGAEHQYNRIGEARCGT